MAADTWLEDVETIGVARRLCSGGLNSPNRCVNAAENPPVEPGSIDCVISNGVINLSPDKPAVIRAAAAAPRPGGRLAIADIVSARHLPLGITCDASLWAACIGGAAQRDDYLGAIRDAGFEITVVRDNDYRFISDRALGATATYGVTSISVLATKR